MSKKIKVLIIDDSALVRQALKRIIETEASIEIIGTANDPYQAVELIQENKPDVITLDIEMPRMDGLTFLKKLMSQHPIPVIVISSLSGENTQTGLRALELGAMEIITKPKISTREFFEESKIRIIDAIKAASLSVVKRKRIYDPSQPLVQPKYSADVIISKKQSSSMIKTTEQVVAIGASTGGTEAITEILQALPDDAPGIVIVQHMPEHFTRSFAERLNAICKINVKEAANGDPILRGQALIAPGNNHMIINRSGARYYVEVKQGPLVNRHRPSVDVLFRSAAKYAGRNAVGVILTGMGDDGAKGLLEMKDEGARTIAQDEHSCIVYGMPKEAIKLNAASKILPLKKIPEQILLWAY